MAQSNAEWLQLTSVHTKNVTPSAVSSWLAVALILVDQYTRVVEGEIQRNHGGRIVKRSRHGAAERPTKPSALPRADDQKWGTISEHQAHNGEASSTTQDAHRCDKKKRHFFICRHLRAGHDGIVGGIGATALRLEPC